MHRGYPRYASVSDILNRTKIKARACLRAFFIPNENKEMKYGLRIDWKN